MALNQIIVIGRLCADPEGQYTSSGHAVTKFRVAVDRDFKNQETGERETDFFNCVAWRKTAEFVSQYVTKGRLVAVSGRMQVRSWVTDSGEKRYVSEIVAASVQPLDKQQEGGSAPSSIGNGHAAEPGEDPFADE